MKKLIVAVMAIAIIAMAGVAMASGTATVSVSATVVGICKFRSGGSVTFTLDPSVGGDVTGNVTQPQFWCTKKANYTITDDGGLYDSQGSGYRMKHESEEEYIPYTFTYTASGTGQGRNNPITMNIASTVLGSDYIDKPAGNYADTVTLTINP